MIKGATYRHISCLDMDVYVHQSICIPEGYEVVLTLFDRTYDYIYQQPAIYTIKSEDMWKWELIS